MMYLAQINTAKKNLRIFHRKCLEIIECHSSILSTHFSKKTQSVLNDLCITLKRSVSIEYLQKRYEENQHNTKN